MNCDRLKKLIKGWYLQVQDETMAPARMVAFMGQHIAECEECLAEPEVAADVEKIRGIVLPPSKVPKTKAVKSPDDKAVGGEKTENDNGDEHDDNGDDNGRDDKETDVKS